MGRGKSPSTPGPIFELREAWEILQEAAGLVESSLALESDLGLNLTPSLISHVNFLGAFLTLVEALSPCLENTCSVGCQRL